METCLSHFFSLPVIDETRLRIAPDVSSSGYTRGAPPTRKHEDAYSREDKGILGIYINFNGFNISVLCP